VFQAQSIIKEGKFCDYAPFTPSVEETISLKCKEALEIDRDVTWNNINTTINELTELEKLVCLGFRNFLDDEILNDWLIDLRLNKLSCVS